MRNQLLKALLLALPITLCSVSARGAAYTNNLNADPSAEISIRAPAKWVATGSHDGSGYISVTDNVNDQQAAIVLPPVDPDGLGGSLPVSAFTFKAKIRIGGGSARPADGMSFSWVDNADPLVGAGTVGEEGATTGLVVSLDTWDNRDGNTGALDGDGPAMDIKLNNTIIAHKRFAGDGSKGGYQKGYCSPVETNAAGPMSLETDPAGTADPGVWADIEISLNKAGALTVIYKGTEIYKDVPTGYTARGGRWVIGARTGGANDNHWIDDISVVTDTTDPIPRVSSFAPNLPGGRDRPENSPIQFVIDGSGSFDQVDQASIRLTVNGSDVTTSAGTMIVPDPAISTTTITYTSPTNYAPGQRVEAVLTYRSTGASAPVTARNTFFVTPVTALGFMDAPTLFIEAEDFNYSDGTEHGKFFDFGSPAGSYNTLTAQHDVDYHLNLANTDSPEYRMLTPPHQNGMASNGDTDRAGTAITPNYKVGWNDNGDWFNFTRTFPNTTYKIYGRFASGGADTHAQLAKVTGATTSNQTTQVLGTFDDTTTGGWDSFCFIPLRSAGGDEIVTRLNGLTTLRVTVLPGNYDMNYLAFVPTFTPTLRPVVTSTSPQPGGESLRAPRLAVSISDQDTAVVPGSIRLFANGTELTPLVITDTPGGADASFQFPTNLPYGTPINAVVIHTDVNTNGPSATQTNSWSFTVGPFKAGTNTLFVEAEDFNFSNDDVTGGLHANFGDPDCSLTNKSGIRGVDYSQGNGNDPGAVPAYRPTTDVEAAKPGGDGFVRGDRTITCSYIVGWNDPGDWQNYTRVFPASSNRYNVFARLSSGGNPENVELARITSDPTMPDQTKEVVGTFSSPASGGWDTFHTVPLRDAAGNLASVRVGGTNTFRISHIPGANFDINYFAFVVADVQIATPFVASIDPPRNSAYARAPRVTAVIQDQDTKVVANSVRLFINNSDVTPSATITDTASGVEISWQAPDAAPGSLFTARIEWRDDQATPAAGQFEWSWTSGIYNAESNLFIEMEDFNTGSGIAYPSFNGVPFNAKGLYNQTNAAAEVDFHDAGNPEVESDVYRIGETPNVGMAILGDANRTGAGPRPGFDTVQDYKVGWTSGGDWYHYTRDFGAGDNYNVYLRQSHGDPAVPAMGGGLDLVNDPVVPDPAQTVRLGEFRAPPTGGWDTFAFVPLRGTNGNVASVQLNGVKTLRYTVEASGGDVNYLMFVPAAAGVTITRSGNNVTVTWSEGALESATDIRGPWAPVTGATGGSYSAAPSDPVRFFRSARP